MCDKECIGGGTESIEGSVYNRFSLSMEMSRLTRDETDGTKFYGANGDREKIIFLVQLTTSRVGNLTRLVLTLAIMCSM